MGSYFGPAPLRPRRWSGLQKLHSAHTAAHPGAHRTVEVKIGVAGGVDREHGAACTARVRESAAAALDDVRAVEGVRSGVRTARGHVAEQADVSQGHGGAIGRGEGDRSAGAVA